MKFMKKQLERISPEKAGISSRQVKKCIEALMHDHAEIHGFMAARDGKVFTECWWKPYGPDLVHSNHSLGKSFTATAIGILCTQGKLDLNERIVDIFSDEMLAYQVPHNEKLDRLNVRHLLMMSTGMEQNPMLNDDWIGEFLKQPIVYEPGEHFLYNTSGACMLGAIVEKKAGMGLLEFLDRELFRKIGISGEDFVWLKFKNGYYAEPGTFSKTEDNLRLAMFYLNYGKWDGEQIVSEEWMKNALSIQIDTAENTDGVLDCRVGYGWQLWACSMPGVFRFDGGQGQYGIIWPEKNLVVALHEGGLGPDGPQITIEAIYDELMRKICDEPLPEDGDALHELREFEQSLAVPEKKPNTLQVNLSSFEGKYRIVSGDADCDPWVSVSPGSYNFFRAFFDPMKKESFECFSLSFTEEKCVFTADDYAVFEAYFDGKYHIVETDNPLSKIRKTASTARFIDENTLEITTKWLNSWFENVITFKNEGDTMYITTSKDRLQEAIPELRYTVHHAIAKRE